MQLGPNSNRSDQEKMLWQSLKGRLKADLDKVIDQMIYNAQTSNNANESADTIVDYATREITLSSAYKKLQQELVLDVITCVKGTSSDVYNKAKDWKADHNNFQQKSQVSLSSSLSSSLNQSSLIFLTTEQLQEISHLLLSPSPLAKLEALQLLSHLSSLEQLLAPSVWSDIRSGLCDSLTNRVGFIKEGSLKVFIKMLSSPVAHVVNEALHSLLEFLSLQLFPRERRQRKKLNESLGSPSVIYQVLRVINQFQQHIAEHWLRYPQSIMEDIIKSTIKFLDIPLSEVEYTQLWNLLAVVDLQAVWMKNWLYENLSRSITINALTEHTNIIKFALEYCEKFTNDMPLSGRYQEESLIECEPITEHYVPSHIASHAACIVVRLLQYSDGKKLIAEVVNSIGSFGWNHALRIVIQCAWKLCDSDNFKSVSDVFVEAFHSITLCDNFNKNEILELLIHPITVFQSERLDLNIIQLVARCLAQLVLTDSGKHTLINFQYREQPALSYIIQSLKQIHYTEFQMKIFSHSDICFSHIVQLINLLLNSPEGILWALDNDLVDLLADVWNALQSYNQESLSHTHQSGGHIDHVDNKTNLQSKIAIRITFNRLLESPIGVMVLHQGKILQDAVGILCKEESSTMNNWQFACTCDFKKMAIIFSSLAGCEAVIQSRNFKQIILKFWKDVHSYQTNNTQQTSDDSVSRLCGIMELRLAHLLSSFIAIENIFAFCINDSNATNNLDIPFENFNKFLWKHFILSANSNICTLSDQDEVQLLCLHVLCFICSCLKSFCFLQANFNIQETLIDDQKTFLTSEGNVIIDALSILRNNILVRTYVIGGSSERILPPKALSDIGSEYKWPFVLDLPVPNVYYPKIVNNHGEDRDKSSQLKLPDDYDINTIKNYFTEQLTKFEIIGRKDIIEILEKSEIFFDQNRLLTLHCENIKISGYGLTPEQSEANLIGIDMCIQYGLSLNLVLCGKEEACAKLFDILKVCYESLGYDSKSGFNFFAASVFLAMECQDSKTITFLKSLLISNSSVFIWLDRSSVMAHNRYVSKSCLTESVILECFNLILKDSLPCVYNAFQLSHYHPGLIFKHWVGQCFWNYLNWSEICNFLCLLVIYGGEYVLYFCIAVVKHLQSDILSKTHQNKLLNFLKESPIIDFSTAKNLPYIFLLAETYHSLISERIGKCFA